MDAFPDETVFEFAPIEDIRSPILQTGFAHWKSLCGERRFPARHQLRPHAIAGALNHLVLAKVLDDGADFEFRIVGDTSARSFHVPRQGRKLSEIGLAEPLQAMRLAGLYACCVRSKAPVYVRGTIGHDATAAKFTHFDAIVLPMGPDDDTVDHILGFGVYEKRFGAKS
jgi:hypothetical protein